MADQDDFSTLMAEPCDPLDHPPISDLLLDFCSSALPAPTKFWRSAKLKNKDSIRGVNAASHMLLIRNAMALANGQNILRYESASWGECRHSVLINDQQCL